MSYEKGFGVVAIQSTTDAAADIVRIDYMGLQIQRRLARAWRTD